MRPGRFGRSLALLAAGVVLLVTSFAGAAASAADDAASELGFFDVAAESSGIGASFGDPATQPYPVVAGLLPNALATLSAGPSGQARSSVLWPGPLVGNAGSLANVVGTPLPPEVVSNANYPVVAQAAAAGGGSDEATLGPMTATVDGADSRATTTLSDVTAPDVVTAARVVTTSRSYVEDGTAIAVADTVLEGVEVAGVLGIARVHTIARGTTDGVTATTTQEVTLSGVTLADQAATIDREGIHVGGGTVPAGEALTGAKPAFDGFGIRAFVTDPLEQGSSGGAAVLRSGSVIVEWSPPQSGQFFTVVLGGSSVRVSATPGSALAAVEGAGDGFFSPADPATVLATPSFSPSADAAPGPRTGGAPAAATASPDGDGGASVAGPIQSGPSIELASAVSDRVPFGWVLVGIVGALLAATGLHSFRRLALDAPLADAVCPLDDRRPS